MRPKYNINLEQLTQTQFEAVLNALILLKQSNPKMDVYLNENFIRKVINEIFANKNIASKLK